MRVFLLSSHRRLLRVLSGRGLGRFRPLRAVHNFVIRRLEEGLVEVQGHKMLLDPIDLLGLKASGIWEPLETDLVTREVRRGDVVLDIGAHIGYYSLIFARLVGSEGRVFAFEPDPDNFALLNKNVRINGYRNVTLVRKAVADRTGKVRLYVSEENNGDHRTYDSKDGRKSIEVKCVQLDEYFRDYGERIDFIKMDIQGAEPGAIRGMSSLLERSKNPRMVVEFWPFGLKRFGVGAEGFLRLLNGHGYSLYNADERKGRIERADIETLVSMYDPEELVQYTNLFCVREAQG